MKTKTEPSGAREQAYCALKKCAERMGRAYFRSGVYWADKLHPAYPKSYTRNQQVTINVRDCILFPGKGAYRIADDHKEVIQAMSDVLSGEITPDEAMNLIHRGDIEKLRLSG